MTLWAKNPLLLLVLAAGALSAVALVVGFDVVVPVPDMRNAMLSFVPMPILLAAVTPFVVGVCLTRRWGLCEVGNCRFLWVWDLALAAVVPVVFAGVALALGHESLLAGARTSVVLVGVCLLGCAVLPSAWVSVAPLAWLVVSLVFGWTGERYDVWAWPADRDPQNLLAWLGCAALAVAGAAAYVSGPALRLRLPQAAQN